MACNDWFSIAGKAAGNDWFSIAGKAAVNEWFSIAGKAAGNEWFSIAGKAAGNEWFSIAGKAAVNEWFSIAGKAAVNEWFSIAGKAAGNDWFSIAGKAAVNEWFSIAGKAAGNEWFSIAGKAAVNEWFSIAGKAAVPQTLVFLLSCRVTISLERQQHGGLVKELCPSRPSFLPQETEVTILNRHSGGTVSVGTWCQFIVIGYFRRDSVCRHMVSVHCYRVLPEGQCLSAHGVSSLLSGTSGGTVSVGTWC